MVHRRPELPLRRSRCGADVRRLPGHRSAHARGELPRGAPQGECGRGDLRGGDLSRGGHGGGGGPELTARPRRCWRVLGTSALLVTLVTPAVAQRRAPMDRYDETFRKYSKRYFGPGFDWR